MQKNIQKNPSHLWFYARFKFYAERRTGRWWVVKLFFLSSRLHSINSPTSFRCDASPPYKEYKWRKKKKWIPIWPIKEQTERERREEFLRWTDHMYRKKPIENGKDKRVDCLYDWVVGWISIKEEKALCFLFHLTLPVYSSRKNAMGMREGLSNSSTRQSKIERG